jgi:hypothetical protein
MSCSIGQSAAAGTYLRSSSPQSCHSPPGTILASPGRGFQIPGAQPSVDLFAAAVVSSRLGESADSARSS